MLSPIKPQDPSKLFGMTHTLFRKHPLPKPSRSASHPPPQPDKQPFHPPLSITKPQPPLYIQLPPQPTPTQAKDKSPMQQYSAQIIPDPSDIDQTSDSNLAVSDDPSESETESSISSSDFEKSYADITRILMPNMKKPSLLNPQELTHSLKYPQILRKIHQKHPQLQTSLLNPKMIINLQMVHGSLLIISLQLNGETNYPKWPLGQISKC